MFIGYNKVRMHDTDMAGILYFPRQFRFVHDTLEELMNKEGIGFDYLFRKSPYVFVIVHAEADYLSSVNVGDPLEIHLVVENIRKTSFTIAYTIYKADKVLMGRAKTVHVCLESKTRQKIPVPDELKKTLSKYKK